MELLSTPLRQTAQVFARVLGDNVVFHFQWQNINILGVKLNKIHKMEADIRSKNAKTSMGDGTFLQGRN